MMLVNAASHTCCCEKEHIKAGACCEHLNAKSPIDPEEPPCCCEWPGQVQAHDHHQALPDPKLKSPVDPGKPPMVHVLKIAAITESHHLQPQIRMWNIIVGGTSMIA